MKKINLTVTAPALEEMINELRKRGLAVSDSEAVNLLLRELYDCRRRAAQPQPQAQEPSQSYEPPSAPETINDEDILTFD